MRDSSSPSHLDSIVTGEASLLLLVADDDEGPAVLVERHRSWYSGHLGEPARSNADRLLPDEIVDPDANVSPIRSPSSPITATYDVTNATSATMRRKNVVNAVNGGTNLAHA